MKVQAQNTTFKARFNVDARIIKRYPHFLEAISDVAKRVEGTKSKKVANLVYVDKRARTAPGSGRGYYVEHLRVTVPKFFGQGEELVSTKSETHESLTVTNFKNWLINSLYEAGVLKQPKK